MEEVAAQPIVTYVFGFTGRSKLDEAFQAGGLSPEVVLTATDTDVIKTYVRLGFGAGIIASMAFDEEMDRDLIKIDVSHLFAPSTTHIGCRKGAFLRQFMYEFIILFAPHLTRERVQASFKSSNKFERQEIFRDVEMPQK